MVAVLERAVRDLGRFAKDAERADTRAWFRSTWRGHLFAFENVAEVLGLDAAAVRTRLLGRRGA